MTRIGEIGNKFLLVIISACTVLICLIINFYLSYLQDILSDDSSASESGDDSPNLPTPEREVRDSIKNVCVVPNQVCFVDLTQLDKFMKQLNQARVCTTPGYCGDIVFVHVKSAGQGGAVTIGYTCNGCVGHTIVFETSSRYKPGNTTEISVAVQVAFIIAGRSSRTLE